MISAMTGNPPGLKTGKLKILDDHIIRTQKDINKRKKLSSGLLMRFRVRQIIIKNFVSCAL